MPKCKACDATLTPQEIVWDAEIQEHEELCRKCQASIYDADITEEIDTLYNYDINIE